METVKKLTPFGRKVKYRLIDMERTQTWLQDRIKEETGLFVDSGYMYKILTGQRNAPKIVAAICEILGIESVAVEDLETYRAWKAEVEKTGKSPEELLAHYEAIGMTEYARKLRAVISQMEESAAVLD